MVLARVAKIFKFWIQQERNASKQVVKLDKLFCQPDIAINVPIISQVMISKETAYLLSVLIDKFSRLRVFVRNALNSL